MAEAGDRKLYLGPKLRVLRRELGINQTQMAEELGISPSYLNHLERNQRPLTAQMLLRLASTYDIDLKDFASAGGDPAASGLHEILADDLVRDIGIPRQEVLDVAENYPGVAEAIGRLYAALTDLRKMPDMLREVGGEKTPGSPLEWLRAHVEQRSNHFPDLDGAMEALAGEMEKGGAGDPAALHGAIVARLAEQHGISMRIVPDAVIGGALRHYDFHRRRLMLSERLPASGRLFALAWQLASVELVEPLRDHVVQVAAPDDQTRRLLLVMLTNYAAAALVMPYERFRKAADESGHDLDLLQTRFGVSFEQLAHRLTTLARQGARGIPFFLMKLDMAGTVSKRFAGEAFPFARFGGTCPRWDIHATFRDPGRLIVQMIEAPDGKRFVTLSKAMDKGHAGARGLSAIGLGCDVKYIGKIAAAAGLTEVVTSIGPTCHLCEREACPDRALPPIARSLDMSPHGRAATPFPFRRV